MEMIRKTWVSSASGERGWETSTRNNKGDPQGLLAQEIPTPIRKIRELEGDYRGRGPEDIQGERMLSF